MSMYPGEVNGEVGRIARPPDTLVPRRLNYNQLPDGESSFNVLFGQYVSRSARRGLWWELTKDEFRALTKLPCTYCGSPPNQCRNTTKRVPGYIYSGLDRVDPSGGYTPDNVVPCCGRCNRAKSDLTLEEWREQIRRLWERIDTW